MTSRSLYAGGNHVQWSTNRQHDNWGSCIQLQNARPWWCGLPNRQGCCQCWGPAISSLRMWYSWLISCPYCPENVWPNNGRRSEANGDFCHCRPLQDVRTVCRMQGAAFASISPSPIPRLFPSRVINILLSWSALQERVVSSDPAASIVDECIDLWTKMLIADADREKAIVESVDKLHFECSGTRSDPDRSERSRLSLLCANRAQRIRSRRSLGKALECSHW